MSGKDCVQALRAAGLRDMADWAEARPVRMGGRGRTCRDLWASAPKGAWLLEYAALAGAPCPALVRAAAACVRPTLRFVPEGEDRPRRAVEAAEAWADDPSEENRRRAEKAADAAWKVAEVGRAAGQAAGEAAGAAAEAAAAAAGRAAARAVAAAGAPGVTTGWAAAGAAGAAAWTRYRAEGPEARDAAHAACAAEVRRLVPFLDLAGGGR